MVDSPVPNGAGNLFVGRRREIAPLEGALDHAMAGRGGLAMLAGEPGIGKTRIARELVAQARSLGAQTFWGWSYEQEGAPPYWPWLEPIRLYIQDTDTLTVAAQMGQGAGDIGEIIPELRNSRWRWNRRRP